MDGVVAPPNEWDVFWLKTFREGKGVGIILSLYYSYKFVKMWCIEGAYIKKLLQVTAEYINYRKFKFSSSYTEYVYILHTTFLFPSSKVSLEIHSNFC